MGLCIAVLGAQLAKADLLFTGSQANVLLHSVSPTDVQITVSLIGGATAFLNTGQGANHLGFAFNLAGPPITSANILNSTNLGTFHSGPLVTKGSALGAFEYYFDNLGNGGSAHNAGPITFDIVRLSGVALTDFLANGSGFYFTANTNVSTGKSGIGSMPTTISIGGTGVTYAPTTSVVTAQVPEPATILLLGAVFIGILAVSRARLNASLV